MQVLNIFSWLPAKEISLEKLEQIIWSAFMVQA
jgi:hypothetical protein